MMISTRGRYALRMMVDLAQNGDGNSIAMKTVAARQGISLKYMEKILPLLVEAGLVKGTHGKGGGYRLTRLPEAYSVGEILRQAEGGLSPVSCMEIGKKPCERSALCPTLPLWRELDRRINEYLDSVTLADLVRHAADSASA